MARCELQFPCGGAMSAAMLVLAALSCSAVEAVLTPITGTPYSLERVRNISGIDNAGYAFLSDVIPGALLVNRFGAAPFVGKSEVSLVNLSSGSVLDVATGIDWPNVATIVDESVFGFKAAIVGSGFLVPSHTTGGMWIVELAAQPRVLTSGPVKITRDISTRFRPDSGWFYHQGDLVDMNGDGLLDIVTSRCAYSVEPWNPKRGKMVWLEQPRDGALSGAAWTEHQIQDGPDFLFAVAPTTMSGSVLSACAPEYISERLVYIYGSEKDGYAQRVVDGEFGPGFGCTWVDLNGDGKLDLLATNHMNANGSVFAYSWDGDLSNPAAVVHKYQIASGFSAVSTMKGSASPGDAIPFFATTGVEKDVNRSSKPFVLVSGDNGNNLFILVPKKPDDPTDWTYTKQMVDYIGADVGRIAIGDTDGDGYNELFVPAYDHGQILHYKLMPTGRMASAGSAILI
jgi:hypothetical protein